MQLQQEIGVPITTLCPCSKAISDYGAHNQRGLLSIRLFHDAVNGGSPLICLEDVVELAERSGSAPLYPVLKREDERFVTMQAFDHPRFVEDVARSAATLLRDAPGFDRFSLRITNFESIHDHNAFARVYPTAPKDV